MKISLRPYQRLAIDNAKDLLARGINSFIIHLATGLGKTVVTIFMVKELFDPHTHNIVIVGGINRELTFQMESNFRKLMPELTREDYRLNEITSTKGIGIVMGNRNDVHCPLIVGSIQTLVDKSDSVKSSAPERQPITKDDFWSDGKRVWLRDSSKRSFLVSPRYDQILANRGVTDVWFHDEAHHAVADGSYILITRLRQLREAMGLPELIVVGNTATPIRADDKSLASIFQTFAISRNVAWAQANEYLVPFADPLMVRFEARHQDGYVHDKADLNILDNWADKTVDVWKEQCQLDEHVYRPTMIFVGAINEFGAIDASKHLRQVFADRGIPAAHIDGLGIVDVDGSEVSNSERHRIFSEFSQGKIKILINHNVLVEGVDLPLTSAIFLLRKVNDVNFTQIIGRALRKFSGDQRYGLPEKEDCLLVDFMGQELVINSVASLIGFKHDPFKNEYVFAVDIDELVATFRAHWQSGEYIREMILQFASTQKRFKKSNVLQVIDLVTVEGLLEVALTDTQVRILKMLVDFMGEDTVLEGTDTRDLVPKNYIMGQNQMYSIKQIVQKSSGDWFSDIQTAIMTLSVGKNDSLLIHPPHYTLARKSSELLNQVHDAMIGEGQPSKFSALSPDDLVSYEKMFEFAEALFGTFTLWHIDTTRVTRATIKSNTGWVRNSEELDQIEMEAMSYAHDHIPGQEDIFMGKRKTWKQTTVNGKFNEATPPQIGLLKNLAGDKYEGLPQPISKGQAAKYITYFSCCKPVNKIVDKLSEQIERLYN